MHRSITLSELISSTFSNNVQEDKTAKNIFVARIAIGIIEFFTSTLLMSYGTFFSEYVDRGIYSVREGIWTTIIYTSVWHMTGPFTQSFNSTLFNEGKRFRWVVAISTVCLAIGVLLPGHIIFYGIFGGFFSKIIYLHIKAVVNRYFNIQHKIYEANIQCAKAISLLIMPHLLLFIVDSYSVEQGKLVYGVIFLNIIPAVLILRPPRIEKAVDGDPELSRYNTLPGLSHQMREMMDFTDSNYTSDITYNDFEYPNEDDIIIYHQVQNNNTINDFNENQVEELPQRAPLMSSAVQDYFSKAGVTILPEIPEEKEIDDDQVVDNNYIDPKRLSMISAKLEELCQNDKPEEVEVMNINDLILKHNKSTDNIQTIEYISNYRESGFFSHVELTSIPCCSCPTHKVFSWKRKFRNCKDMFCDILKHFSHIHLYPIIITKFSTTLVSTLFLTLAPYFASKKNYSFKREDTAFLLSYIAFSWCLFLLLLPLVVTFSEKRLRGSFICGLFITGSSMIFLWKETVSNDFITLNCLMYGFGYGMVTFTENFVYKHFVGIRRWNLLQGSLEILTAIMMTLTYYLIYIYDLDIISLLPPVAFFVYIINAIMWLSIPVCKKLYKIVKGPYKNSSIGESFLTF